MRSSSSTLCLAESEATARQTISATPGLDRLTAYQASTSPLEPQRKGQQLVTRPHSLRSFATVRFEASDSSDPEGRGVAFLRSLKRTGNIETEISWVDPLCTFRVGWA
jgi:hypothetical protein